MGLRPTRFLLSFSFYARRPDVGQAPLVREPAQRFAEQASPVVPRQTSTLLQPLDCSQVALIRFVI
jgi:hypothetical protein